MNIYIWAAPNNFGSCDNAMSTSTKIARRGSYNINFVNCGLFTQQMDATTMDSSTQKVLDGETDVNMTVHA